MRVQDLVLSAALLIGWPLAAYAQPSPAVAWYGIETHTPARAYLNMPHRANGKMPRLLSQTGAFTDTRRLIPVGTLIPYDLVVPFWSDGAAKLRWIALPAQKIFFSENDPWQFPAGTVFIKHFELPTDARDPASRRRLETRLLVRDDNGGVYGVTYKWRADGTDAELLRGSVAEDVPIRDSSGQVQHQTWYYPSPKDCMTCHTAGAGAVLGVKTRQMDRDFTYPDGVTGNELRTWSQLGLFTSTLPPDAILRYLTLAAPDDTRRSLEDRARSYLDANCSHCHHPGGTVAYFDARYTTPLDQQGLVNGPVLIDQGIDRPRVISPHDVWRSIAFMRVSTNGDIRMPPLARETIDRGGVTLLGEWINSLPGRAVLAPPTLSQPGGTYDSGVEITLQDVEPGAAIRYTLDGSEPGTSDPLYQAPIRLTESTVLRARAYKDGFTRSIDAQEVYIIGP